MRGALAVVTVVLIGALISAGCQDPHGVEVIVEPGDPAVTSVRLFIGLGSSTNSSLTPLSKTQVDDVEYWSRDPNNASDVVTGVDGTGEVRFLYVTSDTIPVAIAVGYDANHTAIAAGALTDLAVRDSGFTGYALALSGSITPLGTQGSPLQLELWSPDRTTSAYDAACAGIVVAGADHPYFVVTDQDQDCDGLADSDMNECTPDVYLGTRAADPSETSCLVSMQVALGGNDCKLGGASCTDNVPRQQNMCIASHTCALDQLCTLCGSSFDCAADLMTQIAQADHYECAVTKKADGTVCATTFTLARPPTGGYGCSGFAIGDATTTLGGQLTVGGVELDASLHDSSISSCAGKLAAKGSTTAMVDFTGLVTFTLKNNAGVAMPLHVTATTTNLACPTTAECALVSAVPQPPITAGAFQPALTACEAAWGPVAVILGLATANQGANEPTLSADQLELIFNASGTLMRTTRTAIGGMWTLPLPIQFGTFAIPTGATFSAPALSPDGVQLFFAMTDPAASTTTMFYMTRNSPTTAQWNMPAAVVYADNGFEVRRIAWGPGTHVAIGATSSLGMPDIYDATFDLATKTLADFAMIEPGASHPYLTADGMHLYFDRQDTGGKSTLDVASRRTPTETFAPAVTLTELATGDSIDTAAWVPSAGHTIYFGSVRNGATLPALYTAQRTSF